MNGVWNWRTLQSLNLKWNKLHCPSYLGCSLYASVWSSKSIPSRPIQSWSCAVLLFLPSQFVNTLTLRKINHTLLPWATQFSKHCSWGLTKLCFKVHLTIIIHESYPFHVHTTSKQRLFCYLALSINLCCIHAVGHRVGQSWWDWMLQQRCLSGDISSSIRC